MKTYFRKILEGLACIENIQEAVFYTLYSTTSERQNCERMKCFWEKKKVWE